MRIVDIRERTAGIRSQVRNAYIDFSGMTVSLVAVIAEASDGRRLVGYGFHSNGRYAQGGILRERLIPRLLAAEPGSLLDASGGSIDPAAAWRAMMANEKPGGHGDRAVAAGALDMAVWDLAAKAAGAPLWRLLAERCNGGRCDERVMVYPGGGYYYPGKDLAALKAELRGYREQGYRAVKMKIGGAALADDLTRIEAALEVVGGGAELAVDANGRFDAETALAYAEAIATYGLAWYEEPVDPLDYAGHAEVARSYAGALATGENLFSRADTENLLRYAGLRADRDWLQMDPSLAYGLTEYLRILETVEAHGWSRRQLIPHGGHQLALHMAAGLQLGGAEAYPLVFQPYGFADGEPVDDGFVRPPQDPGLGLERKPALYAKLKPLADG